MSEIIGVVGAGTMGNGIAQVCARAGHEVILRDVSDEFLQRGLSAIERSLQRDVDKARLTEEAKRQIAGRVRPTTDAASGPRGLRRRGRHGKLRSEGVDLPRAGRADAPEAILASNTSSISITKLGAATRRPDKVIGCTS